MSMRKGTSCACASKLFVGGCRLQRFRVKVCTPPTGAGVGLRARTPAPASSSSVPQSMVLWAWTAIALRVFWSLIVWTLWSMIFWMRPRTEASTLSRLSADNPPRSMLTWRVWLSTRVAVTCFKPPTVVAIDAQSWVKRPCPLRSKVSLTILVCFDIDNSVPPSPGSLVDGP